ncbi:hypothetical protein DIQ79_25835 [Mycolicibacterium smegmatis]|uniref:Uncharacterized protein n=1 Tax=Mycolicibacterium smegmatis (strain ATCC 700084 / mc(2)155) TaxID=246196 RepID=A0R6S2_MYCS2|nr:hypothetical protein MSMEG_6651 [Mycolicibacterium smegmatis MC2 155]TBM43207.1 hypothetical protein DIQ86_19100 [Mycolicibacterium smegmatis]TBH30760.1 hypothetical protein EYS45_25640 [Mycolicibacterium smegmatis MC2 155]TBM47874.1 hypothetical protein DIQ85_25845 [Mycolicibacterium smegmatis]TBM57028.1 hypothetical protein DIQ83_25750 [Mycolicibacterium smegmatis]
MLAFLDDLGLERGCPWECLNNGGSDLGLTRRVRPSRW